MLGFFRRAIANWRARRRAKRLRSVKSLAKVIQSRFGPWLSRRQIEIVLNQADWHALQMRAAAKRKEIAPYFEIADRSDAVRDADFKPILDVAWYLSLQKTVPERFRFRDNL